MFKNLKLSGVMVLAVLLIVSSFSIIGLSQEYEGTYAMVTFLRGSEFFNWAFMGMRDAAKALDEDIKVELRGPSTWDATQEAQAIRQLTSRGVDGILTTAGASKTMVPAINAAIKQGIPVVGFDSDPVFSNRLGVATTNQFNAGQKAGEEVVEWLDGEGKVIVSTHFGIEYLEQRMNGFKAGLEGSDIEVVQTINDEGKISTAESKITAAIQKNPDVDAIFCAHGNPSIGAAASLKSLGRVDDIDIMAFDFAKKVSQEIKAGNIRATVAQNPYLMGWSGMLMLWSANQETGVKSRNEPFGHVAPTIDTGVSIVYQDGIDQFLNPPEFVSGG
jgi:ribose transport system substrate-binding protein